MKPCGNTPSAFLVRLKGRGTQPRYATCLGAGAAGSVAVDANFNAYVTGGTYDSHFPTTTQAFQRKKPSTDPSDASGFVVKLSSLGKVVYSTYLGGSNGYSIGLAIGVDAQGAAYIGGQTYAASFPGLPPPTSTPPRGFVSRLTPQGNNLTWSTAQGDSINGLAVVNRTPLGPQIHVAGYIRGTGVYDSLVSKLE
jgi:hypothetical protein